MYQNKRWLTVPKYFFDGMKGRSFRHLMMLFIFSKYQSGKIVEISSREILEFFMVSQKSRNKPKLRRAMLGAVEELKQAGIIIDSRTDYNKAYLRLLFPFDLPTEFEDTEAVTIDFDAIKCIRENTITTYQFLEASNLFLYTYMRKLPAKDGILEKWSFTTKMQTIADDLKMDRQKTLNIAHSLEDMGIFKMTLDRRYSALADEMLILWTFEFKGVDKNDTVK